MLRTYLHRRGQIPAAVHPLEKAAMAGKTQYQQETCWIYRFVSSGYGVAIAILQFFQRLFRRHT